MTAIAVVGAGAWGTALADLLARAGHIVRIWAYEADVAKTINESHANTRFLPGHTLHASLIASNALGDVLRGAEVVVFAAPSHALRNVARESAAHASPHATLVVATKGIEHNTFALMTDVVHEEVPGRPTVALSGPSFAAEVIQRQPTAIVAASRDAAAAARVQAALCRAPPGAGALRWVLLPRARRAARAVGKACPPTGGTRGLQEACSRAPAQKCLVNFLSAKAPTITVQVTHH